MLTLVSLPVDILILVLETLGLREYATLSITCHAFYAIVTEYGWPRYLRSNPRPSLSLANARAQWSPRIRARYDSMTDSAWTQSEFIARPLSRMWAGKQAPSMAISASRLVVGAGYNLYSYKFGTSPSPLAAPPVLFEGVVSLLDHPERARNITALTFVEDGGLDQTLEVGFHDGAIERAYLTTMPHKLGEQTSLSVTRSKLDPIPNGDFLENLSSEYNAVLSLSANGHARLISNQADPYSSSIPSSTIELKSRSWVSHLSLQSSTPFAAFGVASTTPLNVHAITDGGQLSQRPIAILHTKKSADLPLDKLPSSAVYGLSRGPLNSPWGASPQILVSGWFDGQVRCYDLRSSSRASAASSPTRNSSQASNDPTPLRPVLSLADRWSFEPIYSVSCGGGSAAHIAAGTARHSVVSFWDVRSPRTGWSVHAPGNDPSPVYSVILESSRFFGVTQSRPFVYDFGPGVSLDTYPSIPHVRGIDNLKQKKGSNRATYHALRYTHNGSGLCNEH
ncbi:hypothetical protein GALMADRAFT_206563 [Galerina marginata CBS 339.88]|uniref:F-box domain-containing protein n=1 Tax=Galerina marginata (strain CBS 339.88) TaxID=685588 RepID=A0A067THT5_GALM3|nr:hypothetical protein GALMADRAFT_206563 [Galerina marginata CBS 339.88]